MNKEFGYKITYLRKKKGISQKEASSELGISQALLSHYEKGIRECGLDFLVRIADFYDVSVDFLLGRTTNPSGSMTNADDIPELDEIKDKGKIKSNTYCLLNRKLLNNSTTILFSLLAEINNKKLSRSITDYLTLAQYNMFRQLYSLEENNPQDNFSISPDTFESYCQSGMALNAARIKEIKGIIHGPELSQEKIAKDFSETYSSLHQLVKNAEKVMSQNFRL